MLRKSILNRSAGFTLIELLVVIAIIAILSAILFPVFARARENARRASCMSNEKQLGLGFMMYLQDYDETFPRWDSTPQFWGLKMTPYVKSNQVFFCPSDSIHNPSATITTANISYGYNYYWLAANGYKTLAAVQTPSQTLLLGDTGLNATGYVIYSSGAYVPSDIHLNGCNFTFVDGHVKWMNSASVIAGWGTTNSMWDLN